MLALVLTGLPHAQAVDKVRLPLIETVTQQVPGDWARKDFWLRLPEHVSFRPGSEAAVILHLSPQLERELCAVTLEVNGVRLSAVNLSGPATNRAAGAPIELRSSVSEQVLMAGWNQIGLRFVLRQSADFSPASQRLMTWQMRRAESHLLLAYERLPLFPETSRFPDSMLEEQLLHPAESGEEPGDPGLVILLPTLRRDVHLRACAILGARLGQPGYARKARLGLMEDWKDETTNRNVIVVGASNELATLPVPDPIAGQVNSLTAGQGMLAEFIAGPTNEQRRWLLVTGADPSGLEKAILTLGHAGALAALPPNPAVIDRRPDLATQESQEQPPGPAVVSFHNLREGPIELRGIYRDEQVLSGWRLSPGLQLGGDGVLNLQFSHAPALQPDRSSLEVLLNGSSLGTVALTPKNAVAGEAKLPLPGGLVGQDPMTLTFRAQNDLGQVGCEQRRPDDAWVRIEGESSVEITPGPAVVRGIQDIGQVLARDRFLQRTAFLVPASATMTELQGLFQLAGSIGKQLPSSPILWPEVSGYSAAIRPAANRLEGRAVVLLGSVPQWPQALPNGVRLAITADPEDVGAVRIQGRRNRLEEMETGLLFAQMLPSPWTSNEVVVAAGSWGTFAVPALHRLFTDPQIRHHLQGDLCAVDAQGRAASYDSRRILPESFADRIQRHIPRGLDAEGTRLKLSEAEANGHRSNGMSQLLLGISGSLLSLVVVARLGLQWDRSRRQRRAFLEDPSLTVSR
jgi:hypothetical protein